MFDYMESIRTFPGRVGFYLHWPDTGETQEFQADLPMEAASVIKIPIMVTAFRDILDGALDPAEELEILPEMKKPSCGALTYMHDGLRVNYMDLITLMIIVSDNTATNLMIDRLGIDHVSETVAALGVPGIALRRKLWQPQLRAQGIENTVTARGIGQILTRLHTGTLLGGQADEKMVSILKDQRLNGKLPFFLHARGIKLAHKTGEDDGVTHDVGIVYTPRPFVICMLGNQVDVAAYERLMQDTAGALAE